MAHDVVWCAVIIMNMLLVSPIIWLAISVPVPFVIINRVVEHDLARGKPAIQSKVYDCRGNDL